MQTLRRQQQQLVRSSRGFFRSAYIKNKDQGTTHFGFKTIKLEEKEHLDYFVRKLDLGARPGSPGLSLVDVAGGTGDIAFRILEHAQDKHGDTCSVMNLVDINPEMLREGERRAKQLPFYDNGARLNFQELNAETLHGIPDNSQDAYTVAFGIRNFTDIPAALRTAHRVLKPGGIFACLEFSQVVYPVIDKIYEQYSFNIIPTMGDLLVNDRDSYQYLIESIAKFPKQEEFANLIKEAGFTVSGDGYENLTFGVAAIHIGVKL